MSQFKGVWPALITPFTAENQVNVGVLRDLVSYHIDKEVSGFYIGGTTGEGVFMSIPERKLVIETVLSEVAGRVPVIVHVGCTALVDSCELALFAQDHGASGISSIVPPYFDSLESVTGYFSTLTKVVRDLPVFPYFISQRIIPLDLMKQLMPISNVLGTKYTGPDMHEFRQIIELGGKDWSVFSGMDEVCVFAAMMGASGNIGSTLNFMPGVFRKIHESVKQGDLARAHEYQLRANAVINVILEFGLMGALKATMSLLGFDCGQPRLPRPPLNTEQRVRLQQALEASEFAELANM